ncbi:hypothetical protein CC86DRAFT_464568 [Ophiobolus disseminans]|uniref:Uncharacterized protein n=1 Tax=Ophiobolus disseminans TaxID=1469910 RepID=A0A6A7ABT1_9PLEO|nr:hypothetical protein CC86DRAFT_464568 [Ophiobolus disseminans]
MEPNTNISTAPQTSSAPSTSPRAPRPGFFTRWAKRPRSPSVATSVPVTAAATVTVAVPSAHPAILAISTPEPTVSAVPEPTSDLENKVTKLRAENKKLQSRCAELVKQSNSDQEALLECVSSVKIETDELISANTKLKRENDRLSMSRDEFRAQAEVNKLALQQHITSCEAETDNLTRDNTELKRELRKAREGCEELKTLSECNQDALHQFTKELEAKEFQFKLREGRADTAQTEATKLIAENANVKVLQDKIQGLQTELDTQQSYHMRLESIGFARAPTFDDSDFLLRIQFLESDSLKLAEELATQTSEAQALAREYGNKNSELTEQLRRAETNVEFCRKNLIVQENTFRTLHTEHQTLLSQLDFERTANSYLQLLYRPLEGSANVPVKDLHTLQCQNKLLVAELIKVQSTAIERQKLITALTAQQQHFVDAFKKEQADALKHLQDLGTSHASHTASRKTFESTLSARESRIADLEQQIRVLEIAAHCMQSARDQDVEDEVAARVAKIQFFVDRDERMRAVRAEKAMDEAKAQLRMYLAGPQGLTEERWAILRPDAGKDEGRERKKFVRRSQAGTSVGGSGAVVREAEGQSEAVVQESTSAGQGETEVHESTSPDQDDTMPQKSTSAAQSESLAQESTSTVQGETVVQQPQVRGPRRVRFDLRRPDSAVQNESKDQTDAERADSAVGSSRGSSHGVVDDADRQ